MRCIVLIVVGDAWAYFGASSRYFGKNSTATIFETPNHTQRPQHSPHPAEAADSPISYQDFLLRPSSEIRARDMVPAAAVAFYSA